MLPVMDPTDADRLATRLRSDFANLDIHSSPVDTAPVPVRVIDCVLSLRRPYDKVVAPRVHAFLAKRPEITTCDQLQSLIGTYPTPGDFLRAELTMDFDQRAEILLGVVRYVIEVQRKFPGDTEEQRMRAWALHTRPGDYLMVGVKGFGIAGFQYLRLLLGADTTKPDIHIVRYVGTAIGRTVTDVQAIDLLERAAAIAGVKVRALDSTIWRNGAR